jgi:hypothetical protein
MDSVGLEGLYDDTFESVVPEFGTCGGADEPVTQSEECKDCSCEKKLEAPVILGKLCYKCKTQRATIKIRKEPSCNECFQYNVTHRFKNCLVRHCKTSKDEPNLVAISGGTNSMSMLHMLWGCFSGNKSQKRMFLKVHVIYI